ncbi:MAG: / family [Planctomycetaceae bacterium]|nr:/ family [Planctomycetaceae bacterium]
MSTIEKAYRDFCTKRFPLPSSKEISKFEEKIGVGLPPEYRSFIEEFNGGDFALPKIESSGEPCPTDRLRHMSGIGATHESAELGRLPDLQLFGDVHHPEVLPIGRTIMNYFILLVIAPGGEDYGWVLLRTFTDSFFLAENIEEFFGLLSEPIFD